MSEGTLFEASEPVDLHLLNDHRKGEHPQRSHGSWSDNNPFESKRAKRMGKTPGKEGGGPEKGTSKPQKIGEAKNKAVVGGGPETVDLFDKRPPGDAHFVLGQKDGKPVEVYWSPSDNTLVDGRAVTAEHTDTTGALEGKYIPESSMAAFTRVPSLQPKPEHFERLAEAFPGLQRVRWRGDMFEKDEAGVFAKPKPLDVTNTQRAVEQAEKATGRKSNWNGKLKVKKMASMGVKNWDSSISLNKPTADSRLGDGPRTLLHEAFHSVSNGLTTSTYVPWRGWEEGAVEGATRAFLDDAQPAIVPGLGKSSTPPMGSYDNYVNAYEEMREKLGTTPKEFYSELLNVPLKDRRQHLIDKGERFDKLSEKTAWENMVIDHSKVLGKGQVY